jgi:hypothetical protein
MALDIPVMPHGACEYCEGGVAHPALAESAARLRQNTPIAHQPTAVNRDGKVFLHVVSSGTASGGCASCSTH